MAEGLGGLQDEAPHGVGRGALGQERVGGLLAQALLLRQRPLEERDPRRGVAEVARGEGQGGEGRGVALPHEGGAAEELVAVAHPLALEALPRRRIEQDQGPLRQVLLQGIARHARTIGR